MEVWLRNRGGRLAKLSTIVEVACGVRIIIFFVTVAVRLVVVEPNVLPVRWCHCLVVLKLDRLVQLLSRGEGRNQGVITRRRTPK